MEEKKLKQYYLVSQDSLPRKEGELTLLPWQAFLERLWDSKITA